MVFNGKGVKKVKNTFSKENVEGGIAPAPTVSTLMQK